LSAVPRPRRRPASYYLAAGIDLRAEARRLSLLPALGGPAGRLAAEPPELTVRRASKPPRRTLGFAVPTENRLSVTVFPGIRRGDLLETLLHELTHLAVGELPGSRRWHGREFRLTLALAMYQAYGVSPMRTPAARHGAYAEQIERLLAGARAA
jgi:hypothetical protein